MKENFSWQASAGKYLELYNDIVKKKKFKIKLLLQGNLKIKENFIQHGFQTKARSGRNIQDF